MQEVTAAREALATLKPQAGGATPLMTPSHAPPTPTHPETPVHQPQQVKLLLTISISSWCNFGDPIHHYLFVLTKDHEKFRTRRFQLK